jgi:hypothetical protein
MDEPFRFGKKCLKSLPQLSRRATDSRMGVVSSLLFQDYAT